MVTQSGISFVFQRTQRSDLRRWWLVERHQEQAKLTNQAFSQHMPTQQWSGVRQVVVPLYGAWASQHYLGSYVDWVKLVYKSKSYWSKWLPLGWESATKPVAFPDELGDPIATYLDLANQSGYGTRTKAPKAEPIISGNTEIYQTLDNVVDEIPLVKTDSVTEVKSGSVVDLKLDGAFNTETAPVIRIATIEAEAFTAVP